MALRRGQALGGGLCTRIRWAGDRFTWADRRYVRTGNTGDYGDTYEFPKA